MDSDNFKKDIRLWERLRSEDENAFSEIYQLYAPALIGFASSKLYSLEEARDLIHDIFVYLWTERKKIQIHSSLQSYLFAITRHRIIDHIRRNVTRKEYVSMLHGLNLGLETNLETNLEVKDLAKVIEKVVSNLPPRTKQIYRLSRNEYKRVSEIAEMLHLSDRTVKNQLTTALKVLRTSLGKLSVTMIFYFFQY
ncbi:RNA polymerase sigma factor [Daejeonella sp.]|uniref:RNA polymerase sigma factor n=1 Tax=Daejeonella sp. TaxID=2805397 RepID=UPI003982D888